MEPDLVYPLLRGRDIARWRAQPSAHILMVQDPVKRTGYEESWLKVAYPHTYVYLKEFEDVLRQRSGYKKYFDAVRDPFYSMYNVGEYTLAPSKVVWRYVATDFTCATVELRQDETLGNKVTIPDHRLMIVVVSDQLEGHFLTSVLNSSLSQLLVKSYIVGTQISTHVLEHVAIPQFDPSNPLHQSLSSLSQRAHYLAARGKEGEAELRRVEEEIDRLAARLWGITEGELEEIRRALAEMGVGR